MKSEQISKITEAAESALRLFDGYIVEVAIRGERGSSIIEVYIDTDQGVTADQCALVSRQLSTDLDRLNIFAGRYRIEVSSPGLGRPLKLPRQFTKNVGRQLTVVSRNENGTSTSAGVLKEISTSSLTLVTRNNDLLTFPLNDIKEAFVVPQLK
jgi:ribosome maturation factor RimP